jgi:hypothetical protein
MVKHIEPIGEVKVFSKEKFQRTEPISVSYSKAKVLTKEENRKVLSEAQSEHVRKLVEANRIKWEAKRQQKEKEKEEAMKRETEALKEKLANEEVVEVVVKPKRIYPPRKKAEPEAVPVAPIEVPQKKKKIVYVSASESEEESEEEIVEVRKKKKAPVKQQNEINSTIQQVERINSVIANTQPANRYASLLRW